ncbi:unnamed protein product [Leptidea sinapis]|uniref:DH domain-containing protein n=1 Tax=Leptidea sinapis TaxID=189913 RepID=A0A5E4QV78_9NEOP|nr:unnamed protein product [Leptidea sinapis]
MMWFKREPKVQEKVDNNGVANKMRKKPTVLKPTRESSERETSTESDKERRRYSDILDIKVSMERRDESDESLYESADCQSDVISASDDALPRLGITPTISKESLKLAVTDEESEIRSKKGHRKTMSLSNPLEIVKNLGDEWFDHKKDDKNCNKKKSRESLWSEEDKDFIHGSNNKLDQGRKNSKKDKDDSKSNAAKRKSSKSSSVGALNFLRRKKTPTSFKSVEAVIEVDGTIVYTDELLNHTRVFLEEEKRFAALCNARPPVDTDTDDDIPTPKIIGEHRRRLSRQTSRSKSKVRGKSQSVKVNTLRKSHSGTLKKTKKKSLKVPASRSRQASIVDPSPIIKRKNLDTFKQNSWLFSVSKGESRREGSTDDTAAADVDNDVTEPSKDLPDKEHSNWRGATAGAAARGVNRAESCRERDAPRRGKHRNASDPNRLTAHHNHACAAASVTQRVTAGGEAASDLTWNPERRQRLLEARAARACLPEVTRATQLQRNNKNGRRRKSRWQPSELIVSEGSHVRWLKVLGGDFLKPLERQPALLPVEELRALFPNLPSVKERHVRLYTELKSVRNEAPNHIVQIRPVADALLNTLGDAGYASCLSRFCRGQRMALEALRERRKKNKELHTFLAGREQLPRCGRLQLRDLLTKYQLLLESILKTVNEDGDASERESEEDMAQLRRAINTAKEVLHSVDTAIRTAENEHRLRTIQSKLEVRLPSTAGAEWDELRRLELSARER